MINGIVFFPYGNPLNQSLVQVFRRKLSDPPMKASDQEHGIPVAACITGADGIFGFSLPSGEYEVRISLNQEVDVTSVLVTVKRRCFRSKKIRVVMRIGT